MQKFQNETKYKKKYFVGVFLLEYSNKKKMKKKSRKSRKLRKDKTTEIEIVSNDLSAFLSGSPQTRGQKFKKHEKINEKFSFQPWYPPQPPPLLGLFINNLKQHTHYKWYLENWR